MKCEKYPTMKKTKYFFLILFLIPFIISCNRRNASIQNRSAEIEWTELNARLAKGWNTWNTQSVLSHVLLPEGFSINLQPVCQQTGDTLKEALIGRGSYSKKEQVIPGPHAYDGSYTDLAVEWQNINIRVQSATKDNELFMLITPIRQSPGDSLLLDPRMLWGRSGKITVNDNKIYAETPSGTTVLTIARGQYRSTGTNIKFSLARSIAFSSGTSKKEKEIEELINQAGAKFATRKSQYAGAADAYEAIQTVLAWNVIYEPTHDRVIAPVSRSWSVGWEGWILFDWDTYFAAYMFSIDNRDNAYANAIAITKEITDKGFIPNFGSARCTSEDRSQPPVGSLVVKEIYKKYREKWFLEVVFDDLLKWNRWWPENREVEGYLCWGSEPYVHGKLPDWLAKGIGTKKGAKWESGMDNSPMWDDAVFDTTSHRMLLADVGLMSLYINDCQNLSEIAALLGKKEVEKELAGRAVKFSEKLKTLWSDEFGLYLNKDLVKGEFSKRLSPTLFYPLLTKVPDQKQAERMMKEHFYNPKEFWGEFIMPSIARNDTAYKDNIYWRGRIWAPLNFLVYLGMRNYDLPGAKKDMVEKSGNLLLKSWLGEKHVFENYNAETGQGDDSRMSDKFYHWGALLGFIQLIDEGHVPSPQLSLKDK